MVYRVMEQMILYFGGDARRVNHALKVIGFARVIGGSLGLDESELQTLECAAALHDIGIHEAQRKHGSTAGPHQELEGPPIARNILQACGADAALTERVCFLVGHHHTYSAVDGGDFQALIEADFLVNAFEDGMEKQTVQTVVNKLFKTEIGIRLANSLYLEQN